MIDALVQDVRYAFRHLRHSPGFAATAILTLAFGIGANTAMFSVLNALVLRSLPVKDPGRLVGITAMNARGQSQLTLITTIDPLKRDATSLEDICAYSGSPVLAVEANGIASQAVFEFVTADCLPTLGVQPVLGRVFTPDEATTARRGDKVVLIGHRFWERMFGADPNVVGRTVRGEVEEATIIGVMPRGFPGLRVDSGVDIIAPFGTIYPNPSHRPPGITHILARLREGATIEQARAELTARWPALMEAVVPATLSVTERNSFRDVTVRVEPIGKGISFLRERYTRPLSIILGLTGVLLLLACANLGGLLLARIAARGPELAIRRALGGSTLRLTRQLFIESLLLATIGTALAVALAWAAIGPLSSLLPVGLVDRFVTLTPDLRVLAVTTLVGVAAAVLISVLPIWMAGRRQAGTASQWDRTVTATSRWGKALLVGQVALCVVLLIAAGLLARSLYGLLNVNPGFVTERILTVRLMPTPGAYRTLDGPTYYRMMLDRLSALPSVRSIGYARMFPGIVNDDLGRQPVAFVEQPEGDVRALLEAVSPGFFETIGVPLRRGRAVQWSDTAKAAPVAVVSESLAQALAPDGNVIGRHIRFGPDAARQDIEIVGIVANTSLGSLRSSAPPVMYRPALQEGRFGHYPTLQIATHGDPLAIASAVSETVRAMGREYAHNIGTLDEQLRRSLSAERLSTTLAVTIAALAVALAFIGVYGLLAYGVARRTREIGVRVALGASSTDVLRMVIGQGLLLTVVGVVIGVPLAVMASRVLGTLMYGVTPSDPVTLGGVGLFFMLLGVTAGIIPARRAVSVDPAITLRSE